MNIDIKCLPGGATDGSTTDGMVHSKMGFCEGQPYWHHRSRGSM